MLKVADASVTWHIKLGVRSMVPHAYIVESHNRVSWFMMLMLMLLLLIVDVVDCRLLICCMYDDYM